MRRLYYSKKPKLKSPYLIAAWPGMGNVAVRAVEFLWEQLKPKEFAEIRPHGLFFPHEAWVVNGQIEMPRLPVGKFFYWQNTTGRHDLIFFLCEAQPSVDKSYEYAQYVIELALTCGVKRLITFASMPAPIDHTQQSRVWATVTEKKLAREVLRLGVKLMQSGQISGMNGLLLSAGKEQQLEGVCFLGEIPLYAIQIENPKASHAVTAVLARALGLTLDYASLLERSKVVEDEIARLINYFKSGGNSGVISEEEADHLRHSLDLISKIPDSAKHKIELLFSQAEKDPLRAQELKQELDRWNVFKEYEDRFLDLFRGPRPREDQ